MAEKMTTFSQFLSIDDKGFKFRRIVVSESVCD